MDTQTLAIRELTREIPMNDMGLPTGVYRVDMLPWDTYNPTKTKTSTGTALPALPSLEEPDENPRDLENSLQATEDHEYRIAGFPVNELQMAFVPLQYEEGFPTFDNGIPFWSRLEFEPVEAFHLFQKYLQMPRGKRPTSADDEYDGESASGTRAIATLIAQEFGDDQVNTMVQIATQYYHTYYWGLRAHCYDLFRIAEHRKQQEIRAVETQGDHYFESRKLRHRLTQYIDSEEDFWDLMTPKVAIDMLKTLTQLERISAGLPAAGPAGAENNSQPFEVVLKQVAQTGRRDEGRLINEDGEVLSQALDDPETTRVLQELIIRGM